MRGTSIFLPLLLPRTNGPSLWSAHANPLRSAHFHDLDISVLLQLVRDLFPSVTNRPNNQNVRGRKTTPLDRRKRGIAAEDSGSENGGAVLDCREIAFDFMFLLPWLRVVISVFFVSFYSLVPPACDVFSEYHIYDTYVHPSAYFPPSIKR